ncbi:hypothetical protein CBD41_03275 [bacterium TMED181]|mgnify:CR=1 FL=1|nr:hypothetical protein [Planctomycetota bacterium]OUW45931.1 MAG: hypothetical protein CBD41_03275 [bacterium TMED181]
MKIGIGEGLHGLPLGVRLGLTGLCLVLLGGLFASFQHMKNHYSDRDAKPEFSIDDVVSAYHGLDSPAPLKVALEKGHPETLPEAQKTILLNWLNGDRVLMKYDSEDWPEVPADILDEYCLSCHTRDQAESQGIPALEYFDDIQKLVVSRKVEKTPDEILAASTHAHALSMSIQGIVVLLLALLTAWSTRSVSFLCALMGLGLLGDISGWWLARYSPAFVTLIMVSGAAYSGVQALLLGGILWDTWFGSAKSESTDS